jgi:hypothetical protein
MAKVPMVLKLNWAVGVFFGSIFLRSPITSSALPFMSRICTLFIILSKVKNLLSIYSHSEGKIGERVVVKPDRHIPALPPFSMNRSSFSFRCSPSTGAA